MRCWSTHCILQTFDAACKVHYECNHFQFFTKCRAHDSHKSEVQKVQRGNLDELDADHDLDQDRFEEVEGDAGSLLVDTKGSISDVLRFGTVNFLAICRLTHCFKYVIDIATEANSEIKPKRRSTGAGLEVPTNWDGLSRRNSTSIPKFPTYVLFKVRTQSSSWSLYYENSSSVSGI